MTLQEAIEQLKDYTQCGQFMEIVLMGVSGRRDREAIATIINAVVKGELK